jgi:ApaG protein
MTTAVTHGILIEAKATYNEASSRPDQRMWFFSYKIRIENRSEFTVQLLRRHWYIFDSAGKRYEVEGEGVIGQQPVLRPGESYEYESASQLNSEIGEMKGTYTFRRETDQGMFRAEIPKFELISPLRKN